MISSETTITTEGPVYISIKDIQKNYFPNLTLKRIRRIATMYVHTIRIGNKILVDRVQFEELIHNADIEVLR